MYLTLIATTRLVLVVLVADVVYWPLEGAWLVTYALGCVLVLVGRFRVRSSPKELNQL